MLKQVTTEKRQQKSKIRCMPRQGSFFAVFVLPLLLCMRLESPSEGGAAAGGGQLVGWRRTMDGAACPVSRVRCSINIAGGAVKKRSAALAE